MSLRTKAGSQRRETEFARFTFVLHTQLSLGLDLQHGFRQERCWAHCERDSMDGHHRMPPGAAGEEYVYKVAYSGRNKHYNRLNGQEPFHMQFSSSVP